MDVLFPRTLEELQKLRAETPGGLVMEGGTDLLVKIRKTGQKPTAIFCIERIAELQRLDVLDDEIVIGAAVTLQQLLECDTIKTELTALFEALSVLASPPVRHSATLVGNVCTASPAGDTLPPLYVFAAEVEISNTSGRRRQSIAEFITGPGKTTLQPDEIVTAVRVPRPVDGTHSVYYKVGKRKAMAIAVASMAARFEFGEAGAIKTIKMAWGSVGPTVVGAIGVEAYLAGGSLSVDCLREAGRLASAAVCPIDDVRASADYRRQVTGNLLLRLARDKRD
ncbi:MAG TPA: xanthine dehydrogenase family protein subunit M [Negativicutes bacterium]|nr:xanthine dehydrogenase family protein subunit M [Negativicutes bacterium]